jgi:hypothetical protein
MPAIRVSGIRANSLFPDRCRGAKDEPRPLIGGEMSPDRGRENAD